VDDKNEEDGSMRIVRLLLIFTALNFLAFAPDWAMAGNESFFRCGTEVIQLGDSNYRVLAKCGPPTTKEFIGTNYNYPMPSGELRDVEQWIYNRGSTDFVYMLMFQGGVLIDLTLGGRGF
jgi:hypothetical protein